MEDKEKESMVIPTDEKGRAQSYEQFVLGKWTLRLRNACGIISVLTICLSSIIFWVTVYIDKTNGGNYPDGYLATLNTVGPLVIGWSFVNVSRTLNLIASLKDKIVFGDKK